VSSGGTLGAFESAGKVGIVIPTYNESASIADLLKAIRQELPHAVILIVDDSSSDETARAAKSMGDNATSVIRRGKKSGRGSAVIEGLKSLLASGCERFIEMDADFSHPPSELSSLLNMAESRKADLLIGSRYVPGSRIENWPIGRRIFSRMANALAKVVLQVPIHDYTNGYRVYSRRAVEIIALNCGRRGKGFISLSEILVAVYYNGLNVTEVPTRFVNRLRGESSLSFAEISNAVQGLIKIYIMKQELMKRS
jgi:dolichol-phosphate mannosyltransferase